MWRDHVPTERDLQRSAEQGVDRALVQWSGLATVNAVKTGDVHILTESWAVRPGPRIDRLVECLSGYVREWSDRHDR
mgnify:CR=1 FL=1